VKKNQRFAAHIRIVAFCVITSNSNQACRAHTSSPKRWRTAQIVSCSNCALPTCSTGAIGRYYHDHEYFR
jgi:hypothetical protein